MKKLTSVERNLKKNGIDYKYNEAGFLVVDLGALYMTVFPGNQCVLSVEYIDADGCVAGGYTTVVSTQKLVNIFMMEEIEKHNAKMEAMAEAEAKAVEVEVIEATEESEAINEMYDALEKYNNFEITAEALLLQLHDCYNKAKSNADRTAIREYVILINDRIDEAEAMAKAELEDAVVVPEVEATEEPAGTESNFSEWLDVLLEEKGISEDDTFELEVNGEWHCMEVGFIVHMMKHSDSQEQAKMKDILIKLDFQNGDIMHFIKHLAVGYIKVVY